MTNLAIDLRRAGEHERARELDEQALAMRQRLYEGDHPDVAASMSDLAILGLTSNQVFGLARADDEWSSALEAALTASRRDDLQHGTNAAYVHGCVCSECREHQRQRMAKNRN